MPKDSGVISTKPRSKDTAFVLHAARVERILRRNTTNNVLSELQASGTLSNKKNH